MGRCWSTCCSCRQDLKPILPYHVGNLAIGTKTKQPSLTENLSDGHNDLMDSFSTHLEFFIFLDIFFSLGNVLFYSDNLC